MVEKQVKCRMSVSALPTKLTAPYSDRLLMTWKIFSGKEIRTLH